MRTSILSAFLVSVVLTSVPLLALANSTLPPLHSSAPRVHESSAKSVPLEVKRTQAKTKDSVVIEHSRRTQTPLFVPPKQNVLFASLRKHHRLSSTLVYPGSLRMNIERIAGQYGWHRVVWSLSEDYRWVGKTRVAAHGLSGILSKLLQNYPLQAQFYEGNHVLVITPRTIQ